MKNYKKTYLKNKNVCTVVLNLKTDDRQFDIEDKLADIFVWSEPSTYGRYKIWINTSEDCLKLETDFRDSGDGTGKRP